MGPKGANLNRNGRQLWRRTYQCLALQLWPILDCSVQQSMEGNAASSSYRHSAKGMELELARAERITGLAREKKEKTSILSLSLRGNSFENLWISLRRHWSCWWIFDVNPRKISYSANIIKLQVLCVCVCVCMCEWMWEKENICNYAKNKKIKPSAHVYYIFHLNRNL